MFALLTLAVVLVSAQASPTEEMREMFEKCKTENNLDNLGNIASNGPTTQAEKCFVGCLYQNINLLTKDGTFDQTSALQAVETCPVLSKDEGKKAEAKRIVQACSSEVTGTEKCTAGAQLNACIRKQASGSPYEFHVYTLDKVRH